MEHRFGDLTARQKKQAEAQFFNAAVGDGYWYMIGRDGGVLSRNKQAQSVCTYPACDCPFDAPSDKDWCAKGWRKVPNAIGEGPGAASCARSLSTDGLAGSGTTEK